MTQARRSRISLPAAILAGSIGVFLFSAGWSVLHRRTPGAVRPAPVATPVDPIAMLETRAAANPGDGEAWHALAAQYFDAGRYADAIRPYVRATELLPGKAILWSALGETRVMASARDPMPAQALTDFRRAVSIDPKDPRARYFLAVARDLAADHAGAIDDWLALLADTPPGAVWEDDLRRTIVQVGKINGYPVENRIAAALKARPAAARPSSMPAAGLPGPDASDLRAAAALSPAQQHEMAEGMVARLETRLRSDPRNVDGWLMLIRSRNTLGQAPAAAAALDQAIAANPDRAEEIRRRSAAMAPSD